MKPSQAFGVIVRVIGLLGWVASFFYLGSTVIFFLDPNYRPGAHPWWQYFVTSAILFLAGWFMLRSADRFVAFAYRSSSSDAPGAPDA